MNLPLSLGILLLAGYFGGIVARQLHLPRITGYLIAGMLLSPSLFNIIPDKLIHGELTVITDIALGIIAYLVGGSLEWGTLKQFGKNIFTILFFQGLGAWIFVFLLLIFLGPLVWKLEYHTTVSMGIVIGAISLATAPAATLAIVREYRAKGPFTTMLLNIVALDDAFAIVAYAIAISIARVLEFGKAGLSLNQTFVVPIVHIFGSLLIGGLIGCGLIWLARRIKRREMILVVVAAAITLAIGLSKVLGVSGLLTAMAAGFVVANWMPQSELLFTVIHNLEDIIFITFFTLAGAHLNLKAMKIAGILGLLIVIGRCGGKYLGTMLGATISKSAPVIRKYLGLGLLPKAGVTIGLILLAKQDPAFSKVGAIMVNAVLASTIINELLAPPLTKYALFKAGEARPPAEE